MAEIRYKIWLSILITSTILIAGCVGKDFVVKSGDLPGFTKSVILKNDSEQIVAFSAKNGEGFIITQIELNRKEDALQAAKSILGNDSEENLMNKSEKSLNIRYINLEKIGDYSFSLMKTNSFNDTIDVTTVFVKGKNLIKIVSLNGNKSLDSSIRLARIVEDRI